MEPWRRELVVIASAYRTEVPGIESRVKGFYEFIHCSAVVTT
jgi:hypothetical protein